MCGAVSDEPLKTGAPVGCRSAWAEVTASGTARLCDEQTFERLAALHCIKVPSRRNLSSDPDLENSFRDFSQADDVIYKPFDMEALTDKVTEF